MARGHIRPHGDDAWRVEVYAGTDPLTGKPRRPSQVVRGTHKDAERALTAMLADLDGGRLDTRGAKTFGDALTAYLDQKCLSIEATTADTYRRQLVYIPDRLKKMPVARVDVEHIEALYTHLRRQGHRRTGGPLSAKSIKHVHTVIAGALEQARRWKWISDNPAKNAEIPSDPQREPSPTPSADVHRLIAGAAAHHPLLPAYIRLSICAGGRRSEIHGLRWSGIDWAKRRITIKDVIVRTDAGWIVKPYPKTGGRRCIVIDQGTLDGLRGLHARALDNAMLCGIALPPTAFVFSDTVDGSVAWNPRTTAGWWKKTCLAAGVTEGTRLHDLRHLMVTHLIDEGLPIPAVSGRAGHSGSAITLDVYAGRVPRSDEVAADIMGKLLDGG